MVSRWISMRWSAGRALGSSGGRGSARANDNRRVRLIRLLAGDDRAPERTLRGSCPVRLQLPLYSDAGKADNAVRQDSHCCGNDGV
jgi:hypothetical protein